MKKSDAKSDLEDQYDTLIDQYRDNKDYGKLFEGDATFKEKIEEDR